MDLNLILQISGNMQPDGIKELNLSNRDFADIPPDVLSELSNLESLNISGNRLKAIPDVMLPRLTRFNCEDNMIKDVTLLKNFPNLTELYITGNPLSSADRYIAVALLPKLKSLDGRSCGKIREADERTTKQVYPQAKSIWEQHFKHQLHIHTSDSEYKSLVKQFSQMVNHTSKCHDVPKLYKLFKVQMIVEQIIKEATKQNGCRENGDSCVVRRSPCKKAETQNATSMQTPLKNARSPVKNIAASPARSSPRISSPYLQSNALNKGVEILKTKHICSPKSKRKLFGNINEGASPKKLLKKSISLDFNPHIFIRCHARDNDPADEATQVWRAAFEPDVMKPGFTTNTVATCGGDTVCLIDCSTGCVLKRYKHFNEDEDFYAIAWSVVEINKYKTKTTILAVAGRGKEIALIHPLQLVCYDVFKAHNKAINCLLFHPSRPTCLFSGGVGGRIHLWEIGLPGARLQHKKLITLQTTEDVLQLAFYALKNVLLAGTEEGLMLWNIPDEFNKKYKDLIPGIGLIANKHKCEEAIVDGLTFVSEDSFCFKYSRTGTMYICSIEKTLAGFKPKKDPKTLELHILAILSWKMCEVDYIYIGSHIGAGILACGDNEGQLWVYDVKRFLQGKAYNGGSEEPEPPMLVLQWPAMEKTGSVVVKLKDQTFKTIINSVGVNSSGEYLVACAEKNLVCIWKQASKETSDASFSNFSNVPSI